MKKCYRCKETKKTSEFTTNKQNKDGLHSWCRSCTSEYYRGYNKARGVDYWKTYVRKDAKSGRNRYLLRTYNISADQYDAMLKSQGGTCATCSAVPGSRKFAVDHDHKCCPGNRSCGKCVRGILCTKCNVSLSIVENTELLNRFMKYLGILAPE